MEELEKDLDIAMEFDQSFLFKKLYEEEYGTYGGNPYTFLCLDFFVNRRNSDFMFLNKLVGVLAAAHLPSVIGVDPSLFDLKSFENINDIRDISKIFESKELLKFKTLRQTDDSRYLACSLPRFMSRIPYGSTTQPVEGLNFDEVVQNHEDFCWSNSAFAYTQRVSESFSKYSWFSAIIGPENGGMVNNLPVYTSKAVDGDIVIKCPTEVAITDRKEKEISKSGFVSLCYCKDTDYSVFFSGQTLNLPPLYTKDAANTNAALSARLQYMINCSRFAHYLKCIMRDKIGSFLNKGDVENYLNEWVAQYVLLNENASNEAKAEMPLSGAKVVVESDPKLPGKYSAIIFLKPHYQMEELKISLRLVANIPES